MGAEASRMKFHSIKDLTLKHAREYMFSSDSLTYGEGWAPQQRNQMTTPVILQRALNDAGYTQDIIQ
jgi:hypothetical protein